jgi:hypothetical protein
MWNNSRTCVHSAYQPPVMSWRAPYEGVVPVDGPLELGLALEHERVALPREQRVSVQRAPAILQALCGPGSRLSAAPARHGELGVCACGAREAAGAPDLGGSGTSGRGRKRSGVPPTVRVDWNVAQSVGARRTGGRARTVKELHFDHHSWWAQITPVRVYSHQQRVRKPPGKGSRDSVQGVPELEVHEDRYCQHKT